MQTGAYRVRTILSNYVIYITYCNNYIFYRHHQYINVLLSSYITVWAKKNIWNFIYFLKKMFFIFIVMLPKNIC